MFWIRRTSVEKALVRSAVSPSVALAISGQQLRRRCRAGWACPASSRPVHHPCGRALMLARRISLSFTAMRAQIDEMFWGPTPHSIHSILVEEGVDYARTEAPVSGGVPPADGRVGPGRPRRRSSRVSSTGARQASRLWSAHAADRSGKPVGDNDVLRSSEHQELARLRRENKQLKMGCDILAKAKAARPYPQLLQPAS